jgi:tyrosyl-tRNA synthetase
METGALHPRDAKMELAREIVATCHGEGTVAAAEAHFRRVFQERGEPEDIEGLDWLPGWTLLELVAASGVVASRSEARRLIEQRGVRVDGEPWTDPHASTDPIGTSTVQIGRSHFYRLRPSGATPPNSGTALND